MKKMKKIKTITVDEDDWDKFTLITKTLNTNASAAIQEFVQNYIVSHKAEFNAELLKFWDIEEDKKEVKNLKLNKLTDEDFNEVIEELNSRTSLQRINGQYEV